MSKSRIQTHGIAEKVLKNALSVISRCDRGEITLDDAVDLLPDDCRRIIEHLLFTFYRQRKTIGKALNKFIKRPPSTEVMALLTLAAIQCRFQSDSRI